MLVQFGKFLKRIIPKAFSPKITTAMSHILAEPYLSNTHNHWFDPCSLSTDIQLQLTLKQLWEKAVLWLSDSVNPIAKNPQIHV